MFCYYYYPRLIDKEKKANIMPTGKWMNAKWQNLGRLLAPDSISYSFYCTTYCNSKCAECQRSNSKSYISALMRKNSLSTIKLDESFVGEIPV